MREGSSRASLQAASASSSKCHLKAVAAAWSRCGLKTQQGDRLPMQAGPAAAQPPGLQSQAALTRGTPPLVCWSRPSSRLDEGAGQKCTRRPAPPPWPPAGRQGWVGVGGLGEAGVEGVARRQGNFTQTLPTPRHQPPERAHRGIKTAGHPAGDAPASLPCPRKRSCSSPWASKAPSGHQRGRTSFSCSAAS